MNLADYALQTRSHTRPFCRVCELPEELLRQLDENEILGLPVSRQGTVRWLLLEGHAIHKDSIARHRERCLGLAPVRA